MTLVHSTQGQFACLSRLRASPALRRLVRETRLHPSDLVQPIFVCEREFDAGPIESMPGIDRVGLDGVARVAQQIAQSGVRAIMVFGIPAAKDDEGSSAWCDAGVVPRAVRAIKRTVSDLAVITDVCLCQYTAHGHCGVLNENGLDLESTLERLGRTALAHARAGTDVVAPSAMLDGMVATIRGALNDGDCASTAILSYAIKHASAFYGPFRDAASSSPSYGDRRSHQLDPANAREALAEARLDVEEGADAIMLKPGLSNLDLIRQARDANLGRPIAAYQVSGEYAMIRAAAERGWLDERGAALESLTALKRAGADFIITYWATRAASWISEDA